MSMYRSRNQQQRWRRQWPWKRLFPPRMNERFCPECKLPFHEGPTVKETEYRGFRDIGAFIFPAGAYWGGEYVVRIGRWRPGGKQLYCSEFIPASELDNVHAVVELAKEKIAVLSQQKGKRQSI